MNRYTVCQIYGGKFAGTSRSKTCTNSSMTINAYKGDKCKGTATKLESFKYKKCTKLENGWYVKIEPVIKK